MRKCFTLFVLAFLLNTNYNSFAQENTGIYIWPSTFYELGGVKNVINILKQNQITDIFLLVKGEDGSTFFPSDYTYKDHYNQLLTKATNNKEREKLTGKYNFLADTTLLSNIIKQAHTNNIRVHAWFIISGDKHYVESHPGSEVVRISKPDTSKYLLPVINKGNINLAYPPYKQYIFSLINKALEYPFDGLMLDKIRYTSLVYTWDEIHISKAMRRGVDMNKVINCAVNTEYGKEEDKESFIYKYRDGDKDIKEWIKIKKEDIEEYVKEAYSIAKQKHIVLSASFMPEGAYDEDFADVNYAQNYKELSPYLDYIVIMAYPKSFKQPASWVKMVTASAMAKSSCKIWTAIQGFDSVDAKFVFDQVKDTRVVNPDGIAVFRLGGIDDKSWGELRRGMNLNIDKLTQSQKTGIIYTGRGTIRNCWTKSAEALLASDSITTLLLNEDALKDFNTFKQKDFILIPGGGGSSEAEALGLTGLNNIDRFVSSGGGYIGICAGSYLPVKGYLGNLTEKLQIVNAEPRDIAHWNRGSGKVELKIVNDHLLFSGIKGKIFELNYFSGPVLQPSDLKLPAYKELAVFGTDIHDNGAKPGDMMGKTAILEARYHNGKIILFSPHPELTPGMEFLLINAVDYVSRVK
jgi:uncharacterized lipoprotein YddW (UPF0748 family)